MNRLLVLLVAGVVSVGALSALPRFADATVPGDIGRIAFTASTDHIMGEIYTAGLFRWAAEAPDLEHDSGSRHRVVTGWIRDHIWLRRREHDTGYLDHERRRDQEEESHQRSRLEHECRVVARRVQDRVCLAERIRWVVEHLGDEPRRIRKEEPDAIDIERVELQSFMVARRVEDRVLFAAIRANGDLHDGRRRERRCPHLGRVGVSNESPSWSPDGSKIAFQTTETGVTNIATMNVDGSGFKKITDRPAPDLRPKWSPDGHHIMFVSNADGDFDLWMVNPDGSNLRQLTDHPGDESSTGRGSR